MNKDHTFDIALGLSRKQKNWKNREWTWERMVEKLRKTHRTAETFKQYSKVSRNRRSEIKDVGAFVGGYLTKGQRKKGSVLHRSLITLDLDFAPYDVWDDFQLMNNVTACIYSTHSHSPENPRYRLVIPLKEPISADKYEPVARMIASLIDSSLMWFDDTTFEPERLMYWPSTAKDGEYIFEQQEGPLLDADKLLKGYTDWTDSSEWPVSDRQAEIVERHIKKQEDPTEKPGLIGAFCRTYYIKEAIDEFLSEEYEACDIENRYTYKKGSTAAGMIVYDDLFAYSHHGTDPIGGKLCNAFDLVRIHKFGEKDEDVKEGVPGNKLPSFKAMQDWVGKDKEVRKTIVTERNDSALADFKGIELEQEVDDTWMEKLKMDRKGNVLNGIDNLVTILSFDSQLKDRIIFDEFDQREFATDKLPWREVNYEKYIKDSDVSNLKYFFKVKYDIKATSVNIEDSLKVIYERNKINSVKDYLDKLEWDGDERLDTLLVDYLGAEDSDYTRAVTRKAFTAAVARAYKPGIKFDYMTTLLGKQGIGKSTLIAKMGGQWFTDSFSFGMLGQGNKAYEQLQGAWLVEAGELTGLKKADVEAAKSFLTSKEDRFRVSYGRRVSFFPRKCVFFGTTNNGIFLRDQTGNRRFWLILCGQQETTKSIFEELDDEVDQLWAEALRYFKEGEKLYLDKELEETAENIRQGHTEVDERVGLIQAFIEMDLPEDWKEWDVLQRRTYLREDETMRQPGTRKREKVCAAEIWCELFENKQTDMNRYNTKFIHEIMQNMDSWKSSKNQRHFKIYGKQRSYERFNEYTDVELPF